MSKQQKSSYGPSRWRQFWVQRFLLGLGLVLLGLLAWFLVRGASSFTSSRQSSTPAPAQAQVSDPSPAERRVVAVAPVDPTAALKSQLERVLSEIKEANQKKDLSLLLSHYSPNFPQLTQRAQLISKNWKIYNYPNMSFDITEVKLLPDKTASARVAWEVEAQNISTKKSETLSKTYLVRFARESGQWRIKTLENAE
jgi:hypothetical protein